MIGHFERFLAEGNDSPGLFLIPQETKTINAVESLTLIWSASDADEWRNRVVWLPL
jgi:hypothetical protein